jgi:hypothetical protein
MVLDREQIVGANPNVRNGPLQTSLGHYIYLRLIRWVVVRFREAGDDLAADFASDSSITNAIANPRSWEMDTRNSRTPIRLARSETFPHNASLGAPLGKLTVSISVSCKFLVNPTPKALRAASLTANLPARYSSRLLSGSRSAAPSSVLLKICCAKVGDFWTNVASRTISTISTPILTLVSPNWFVVRPLPWFENYLDPTSSALPIQCSADPWCVPMNSSAVAIPGWLMPRRRNTFQIV